MVDKGKEVDQGGDNGSYEYYKVGVEKEEEPSYDYDQWTYHVDWDPYKKLVDEKA